ncbi:MAG: c-type cytochrome [Caldilineaceae bacterium]
MENNRAEERSPILVAAGIAAIIIVTMVVLALFVQQNIPSETGAVVNAEAAADAAPADPAAAAAETPTEAGTAAEPTPASAPADGGQAAAQTDVVTDTAAAAGSDSASATTAETSADTAAESSPLSHDDLVVAFATGGCSGCHTIPDIQAAAGQIGPNLAGIGTTGATRIEGLSAEEYIRQSMQDPEAFIAPACPTGPCPTGVMLPNYAAVLSEDQVNNIVAYLLSLTDEGAAAATTEAADAAPAAAEAAPADAPAADAPAAEAPAEDAAPAAAEAPAEAAPVDMAAVTTIVTKGTCGACHVIPGVDIAVGMIGPDLSNIGAEAGTRVPGLSAEEYIRQSIMEPNAVIAPKCPTGDCLPGIMLPNLAEILAPEEIDTIVGYLLTLHGQ